MFAASARVLRCKDICQEGVLHRRWQAAETQRGSARRLRSYSASSTKLAVLMLAVLWAPQIIGCLLAFSNPAEGRCNSPRCRILHSCPRLPRPKTQTPFAAGPFFFRLRRNPRAHDGDMLKTRLVSAYAERRWRKVICDCFAVEADFARTSFSTAVLHLRHAERAPTWRHW